MRDHLDTGHFRHFDVQNRDIDRRALDRFDRFLTVAGRNDLVAGLDQRRDCDFPIERIVVGHQHAAGDEDLGLLRHDRASVVARE